MSDPGRARWISRAHGLLLNAACKRAWGESVEVFDPDSLVEELRPAITEAIGAAGDREEVASTVLDLYRGYTRSESDTVSMVFRACIWTGSNTLHAASEKAIQEAGPAVVEVLREALADEMAEDAAVVSLFDACQSALNAIRDPANRLDALKSAFGRAPGVTDDPDVLKALSDGLKVADRLGEHQATRILFDYYRDEAALGMSSDPWPLLEELIASLQTGHAGAFSDEEALDVLMRALRETIADEGAPSLWEGYQYLLDERDEFGGLANAEALLEAYARLIRAGADTQWLADRVREVCVDIAHARDDVSYLLPDRLQVSDACMATIRSVMKLADVGGYEAHTQAILDDIDPGEALEALVDGAREAIAKADDPDRAIEVFLDGLSVEPAGWPPPTPAWLIPD